MIVTYNFICFIFLCRRVDFRRMNCWVKGRDLCWQQFEPNTEGPINSINLLIKTTTHKGSLVLHVLSECFVYVKNKNGSLWYGLDLPIYKTPYLPTTYNQWLTYLSTNLSTYLSIHLLTYTPNSLPTYPSTRHWTEREIVILWYSTHSNVPLGISRQIKESHRCYITEFTWEILDGTINLRLKPRL